MRIHGPDRRWLLACALLSASALLMAQEASPTELRDAPSGVSIRLPEGWTRRPELETGLARFSMLRNIDEEHREEFEFATTIDADYSVDAWLLRTRAECEKWFGFITEELRVDQGTVDGHPSTRLTAVGSKDSEQARRVIQLVIRGDRVLQFTATSFCGVLEDATTLRPSNLWGRIRIGEPRTGVSVPPDAGSPWRIRDAAGNHALEVPGYFKVDARPGDDPEDEMRSKYSRRDDLGQVCMKVYVLRYEAGDREPFGPDAARVIARKYVRNRVYFEEFFGKGSGEQMPAENVRGRPLGGLDHGSAFEFRGLTMQEKENAREARRRGEEPPDLPETVLRCRATTLSPHIYLLVGWFRPDAASDPVLLGEFEGIAESFSILDHKRRPVPLTLDEERIGVTVTDPACRDDRERKLVHRVTGRKLYKLGVRFTLPAGFRQLPPKDNVSVKLAIQDADHNWMYILIWHANHLATGDSGKELVDWRVAATGWREYWLEKAPGARVPKDFQRVKLSRLVAGNGYKRLTGDVQGWPGTLTAMTFDKSNWRTNIAIETRGEGDRRFARGLRTFLKSLRFDYDLK